MRNPANKQINKQTNRQTKKHTKVIAISRFSRDNEQKTFYNDPSRCMIFCPSTKKLMMRQLQGTTETAVTHPDVRSCEDHSKTIRRAYAILNDEKIREIYDQWGLEKAEDEFSRKNRWSD